MCLRQEHTPLVSQGRERCLVEALLFANRGEAQQVQGNAGGAMRHAGERNLLRLFAPAYSLRHRPGLAEQEIATRSRGCQSWLARRDRVETEQRCQTAG